MEELDVKVMVERYEEDAPSESGCVSGGGCSCFDCAAD